VWKELKQVNPNFSVAHFSGALPYRDPKVVERLVDALKGCGDRGLNAGVTGATVPFPLPGQRALLMTAKLLLVISRPRIHVRGKARPLFCLSNVSVDIASDPTRAVRPGEFLPVLLLRSVSVDGLSHPRGTPVGARGQRRVGAFRRDPAPWLSEFSPRREPMTNENNTAKTDQASTKPATVAPAAPQPGGETKTEQKNAPQDAPAKQ
jgi:hypothetical protein